MFSIDRLVRDCRAALHEDDPAAVVQRLVADAVRDPHAVRAALGEPEQVGLTTYASGPDLTVQRIVWGPGITSTIHEHTVWVVVGVYAGEELNVRYDVDGDRLVEREHTPVKLADTVLLRSDEAHAVTGSAGGLTHTLHVYGGDIMALPRREWISGTPRPFDLGTTVSAVATYNTWIQAHGRLPTAAEGAQLLLDAGYPLPPLTSP